MELKGRKMLVVGVGKTGIETVKFLLKMGANVSVSENSPIEQITEQAGMLSSLGVKLEAGGHRKETFLSAETIVLSPGVPFSISPVQEALAEGIEVISEVELASRFIDKPVIAVTGSNGKTTTSTLISHILEKNGKKVFLGANIGTPLIEIARDYERYDILVLELSSFQLQGIKTFRPEVAVILNISPNHLDHHSTFNEYAESKMKICSNQTASDWFIYKANDDVINKYLTGIKSKKIPFGDSQDENGISCESCVVKYGSESYDIRGVKLIGYHNIENIMAAIAATRVFGCDPEVVRQAVVEFNPLPHRNEFLGTTRGARFYNDSKSTSPGATLSALESLPPPIILIAGGKDKGVSFDALRDIVSEKVKCMVLMGESRFRMQKELGPVVNTVLANSLDDALNKTLEILNPGDTVLFSPACSSFDMFESYQERGRRYKEIVRNI